MTEEKPNQHGASRTVWRLRWPAFVLTMVAACEGGTVEQRQVGGQQGGSNTTGGGAGGALSSTGTGAGGSGGEIPPGMYMPDGGPCPYKHCEPLSFCEFSLGLCCGGGVHPDKFGCYCGEELGCIPPMVCCALPGAIDFQCADLAVCGTGGAAGTGGGPTYKPCTTKDDCPIPSANICQEGQCCVGTAVVDGICWCGEGPGCALTEVCCEPLSGPSGTVACVSDFPYCDNSLP